MYEIKYQNFHNLLSYCNIAVNKSLSQMNKNHNNLHTVEMSE